jgi:hypothetical protein
MTSKGAPGTLPSRSLYRQAAVKMLVGVAYRDAVAVALPERSIVREARGGRSA